MDLQKSRNSLKKSLPDYLLYNFFTYLLITFGNYHFAQKIFLPLLIKIIGRFLSDLFVSRSTVVKIFLWKYLKISVKNSARIFSTIFRYSFQSFSANRLNIYGILFTHSEKIGFHFWKTWIFLYNKSLENSRTKPQLFANIIVIVIVLLPTHSRLLEEFFFLTFIFSYYKNSENIRKNKSHSLSVYGVQER